MEILTPTEACLESSSDLTIATTDDIDIEHVHVFARRPIRSEVLVRCVRSTSTRLENTMLTIRDGRCATVPPVRFIGLFGCVGLGHQALGRDVLLCGGETADASSRRGPSGASDPSCRRVLHPNIHVSDGVFSTESCRLRRFRRLYRNAVRSARSAAGPVAGGRPAGVRACSIRS
jgi:hypothetical protein